MPGATVVLFDLGGVLLPFDRERRISALCRKLSVAAEAARAFMAGDLHRRLDLGEADDGDLARALTNLAGRRVEPDEGRDLILSVFERPNLEAWALAAELRGRFRVGGFSDNPAFVRQVFPPGAALDPMLFSSELGALKPSPEAFRAAETRLGVTGAEILFIDDTEANVAAARTIGWDAIWFKSNAQLLADLAERGLP